MSFFVAEGYYKTSNIYGYIARMGIFAIVSQIPYALFVYGKIPNSAYQIYECFYDNRNVIFTLFISLVLLVIIKSERNIFIKYTALFAALFVTRNSDWSWGCLLWVLGFALHHNDEKKQMLCAIAVIGLKFLVKAVYFLVDTQAYGFSAVSAGYLFIQLGGLMALPLLMRYNGEKGRTYGLGFYWFYPLHMLLLFCIDLFH